MNKLLEKNRWSTMTVPANEITIVHKYKFVYIVNRKSGQSEMNYLLWKHFGVLPYGDCTCDDWRRGFKRSFGRCTTLCLQDSEIQDYFFFTFVRHPFERFFSSFKQVWWVLHHKKIGDISDVMETLFEMNSSHVMPNDHYETQSLQLFSQVQDGARTVSYDFIGKLEPCLI